jgi:hypothetical protein
MSEKPPAGRVSRIVCEFDVKASCPTWAFDAFRGVGGNLLSAKETIFHYDVLLPDGYYDAPDKRYPCMFISSPGGNAKLGAFAARLKRDHWIAIMLVESSNHTQEWLRNFIAAHDDAVARFRIQEGMKYATGFSGGARYSTIQAGVRPGFAGMILQGAGFAYIGGGAGTIFNSVKDDKNLAVCMIMGSDDSNKKEIPRLTQDIPRHTRLKIIMFNGGHTWAPSEALDEAMDWLEGQLLDTTADRAICRLMFNSRVPALKRIEAPYARYDALKHLSDIAVKNKLSAFPEIAEALGEINSELAELRQDKRIQRELKAKTAYDKAVSNEGKVAENIASGKIKGNRIAREKQRLIAGYNAFIKANQDTYHAEKAQERIAKIEAEMKK